MIMPLSFSVLALLLASATSAATDEQKVVGTPSVDPTVTASIKSIFASFNDLAHAAKPSSETACCDSTCPLGLCNDFYSPPATLGSDAARTLTASVTTATGVCCTAGCSDGFCIDHRRPWPPHPPRGRPVPLECPTRATDPACWQTGDVRPGWFLDGCVGRDCGGPTARILASMTTIFPTNLAETQNQAEPTTPSVDDADVDLDPALGFHAVELAGDDQDTFPIIVETSSEDPITLLADVDLSLTENYISSGILEALGLSSKPSHPLIDIPPADQRVAALGKQAVEVRSHAKISLGLLTGPKDALKPFRNVEFNIFDLPSPSPDGSVAWQPELFLGVVFLRDARALRLTDDFAGNPALEGLPVLVRSLKGYEFSPSRDKQADSRREVREKDEL